MQKLSLSQSLQQKLSPQQIQFIKLLEVPTAELETRIEEELEVNPALEEGLNDELKTESLDKNAEDSDNEDEFDGDDMSLSEYLGADDKGYKMSDGNNPEDDDKEMPIADETSLFSSLETQLNFLGLDERKAAIGMQIIGSLDEDGYLRRRLEAIANDLAFTQNIDTDEAEIVALLHLSLIHI